MKFPIAVAVVALALAGADAANAQVQPPQERIDAALSQARRTGIPVALLESKMAEGKAKGVPLERIAAAIERREAALESASQALRGEADATASLAVGADAIESGVNEGVLKAVAENAPRDRRNVAIAALTQLVQQGYVPEAALERVRDALRRGPDALANLPAEAAAGRRGGASQDGQRPGNAGGRSGAESGPPAGVPAPGKPSQAGKPGGQGNSNPGGNNDPGRSNSPGRGRQ